MIDKEITKLSEKVYIFNLTVISQYIFVGYIFMQKTLYENGKL